MENEVVDERSVEERLDEVEALLTVTNGIVESLVHLLALWLQATEPLGRKAARVDRLDQKVQREMLRDETVNFVEATLALLDPDWESDWSHDWEEANGEE